MLQQLVVAPIVLWAGWHVFGSLAPWRQRRVRAWLARQLDGRLPGWALQRLRPGLPKAGCGCGSACTSPVRSPRGNSV
jgi:hypothetical protein